MIKKIRAKAVLLVIVIFAIGMLTACDAKMKSGADDYVGKKHDDVIIDPKTPYAEYDVSRFLWSIKDVKSKIIILFGTGGVASYFYKKFKELIDISFALDNNKSLHGTQWNGMNILSPDNYKQKANEVVIITARDFKSISRQLDKNGITNYFIFIQGRIY